MKTTIEINTGNIEINTDMITLVVEAMTGKRVTGIVVDSLDRVIVCVENTIYQYDILTGCLVYGGFTIL